MSISIMILNQWKKGKKQKWKACQSLYYLFSEIIISGIPQGQAFQRVATILQPKRSNHTATSWIHDGTAKNRISHDENYINLKPAEPYK